MEDRRVKSTLLKEGISLFFPAYNEEENVGFIIDQALAVLESLDCKYEVIIIDDGSQDGTADVVREYARNNPRIVLIQHPINQGYGRALQSGFQACRYGLVFFSDCDLQFNLWELLNFLNRLQSEPAIDAVIGYRIKRADPRLRQFNAWGWKLWARILFGVKVRDVDCAFKLFRRNIFDKVQLEATGALINLELLAKLKNLGIQLAEVGVHHYPRKAGIQTGAHLEVIVHAFYESFQLWHKIRCFRKNSFRYPKNI